MPLPLVKCPSCSAHFTSNKCACGASWCAGVSSTGEHLTRQQAKRKLKLYGSIYLAVLLYFAFNIYTYKPHKVTLLTLCLGYLLFFCVPIYSYLKLAMSKNKWHIPK